MISKYHVGINHRGKLWINYKVYHILYFVEILSMLAGVPFYQTSIYYELVTSTFAGLLWHFMDLISSYSPI